VLNWLLEEKLVMVLFQQEVSGTSVHVHADQLKKLKAVLKINAIFYISLALVFLCSN
jgi:hypothetical protein